jgi:hypothetical protein
MTAYVTTEIYKPIGIPLDSNAEPNLQPNAAVTPNNTKDSDPPAPPLEGAENDDADEGGFEFVSPEDGSIDSIAHLNTSDGYARAYFNRHDELYVLLYKQTRMVTRTRHPPRLWRDTVSTPASDGDL